MNKVTIFIIRFILGLVGGWLLMHFFFPKGGIWLAMILAALVVASAYGSEMWRSRK